MTTSNFWEHSDHSSDEEWAGMIPGSLKVPSHWAKVARSKVQRQKRLADLQTLGICTNDANFESEGQEDHGETYQGTWKGVCVGQTVAEENHGFLNGEARHWLLYGNSTEVCKCHCINSESSRRRLCRFDLPS